MSQACVILPGYSGGRHYRYYYYFYYYFLLLLEKEMATHSTILAWRIPWTEELAGNSPWSCKELDTTERLSTSSIYY